jgi:HSP20 family molecular chaperone IbpA
MSDKGDLTYQVDVSGFRPEELKVSVEGDEIVIEGEHKEQAEGPPIFSELNYYLINKINNKILILDETVHRQFIRRFRIPEGISKDTVKCDIDAKGCLTVNAKKVAVEGTAERKSIPIETKATDTEEPKSIGGEK